MEDAARLFPQQRHAMERRAACLRTQFARPRQPGGQPLDGEPRDPVLRYHLGLE